MNEISLLELFFSGQYITSFFVVLLIVCGIYTLYLFFEKYFFLKEINQNGTDFLDNITDCIYDNRIDAARDLCKRIQTPESKIIKKALDSIEKKYLDLSFIVKNQTKIEILKIKRGISKIGFLARIIFLSGVLGTFLSLFFLFLAEKSIDLSYGVGLSPVVLGSFLGIVFLTLEIMLKSIFDEIELSLNLKGNKFLEIISENEI